MGGNEILLPLMSPRCPSNNKDVKGRFGLSDGWNYEVYEWLDISEVILKLNIPICNALIKGWISIRD